MPPNNAHSKGQESVVDLELNDRSRNASSLIIPEGGSLESGTPNTRRSQDSTNPNSSPESRSPTVWSRISSKIPPPVARRSRVVGNWIKGPQPPRVYRMKPFFEKVQTFPIKMISRLPKAVRFGVLLVAVLLWAIIFGVILSNFGLPEDIGGFGAPLRLSCVTRLWYGLFHEAEC